MKPFTLQTHDAHHVIFSTRHRRPCTDVQRTHAEDGLRPGAHVENHQHAAQKEVVQPVADPKKQHRWTMDGGMFRGFSKPHGLPEPQQAREREREREET